MTSVKFSHADLCAIAVKWLQRPLSRAGHDCGVALSEIKSGWGGEIPDAIGWRSKGDKFDCSVLVECKVSRSDFLADKNKPHRIAGGIGNYRYFLCPDGVIKPDELPANWGLLYVNNRGHVKAQAGPVCSEASYYTEPFYLDMQRYRHDTNYSREQFILVRLLRRLGDPQQLNDTFKSLNRDKSELNTRLIAANDRHRNLRRRCWQLERQITEAGLTPVAERTS